MQINLYVCYISIFSGLGFHTALILSKAGGNVILTCRSQSKCEEAKESIKNIAPNSVVDAMTLDLASYASIKSFVNDFVAKYGKLELFKYLLTKGASITPNLLNTSIYGGNIDLINYIYDNYDQNVNNCSNIWISPFFDNTKRLVIMTRLLDLGANPDIYLNDSVVLNQSTSLNNTITFYATQ
jgi:NAD(P)-dependent dehydrogenase (short-subunit alcohol dehydrogenase family)